MQNDLGGRWLVRLSGEKFDLEEFPKEFTSGDVHCIADGEEVYLVGAAFDYCHDATAVFELALSKVAELYSVLRLLNSELLQPGVGHIVREDNQGARTDCYAVMVGEARGRSKARVYRTGEDPNVGTQGERFLAAAGSSKHLAAAATLLAIPDVAWPALYRAMEEISATTPGGNVASAGYCLASELELFKRTANTAEAAGLHARHGQGKFVPPANPMPLIEARQFVDDLMRKALVSTATSKPAP